MLGDLEDAIEARLAELKKQIPRLTIKTYGGELSDPDLLVDLIKGTPSVMLTTPRVVFRRQSHRRYGAAVVFRLVISSKSVRNEKATRRGTVTADPGSYWIWESCMRLLTSWQHKPDGARASPTEFANLVTGKFQSDHLSVLGQSFAIDLDWVIPEEPLPDLEGIDISYHVPGDNPETTATDNIELRDL